MSVMFPMVATVAEFRAARALLQAEAKRVRPSPERLSIGTMLEVPALMWQLPALLREADFISVGSNDLGARFSVRRGRLASDRGAGARRARIFHALDAGARYPAGQGNARGTGSRRVPPPARLGSAQRGGRGQFARGDRILGARARAAVVTDAPHRVDRCATDGAIPRSNATRPGKARWQSSDTRLRCGRSLSGRLNLNRWFYGSVSPCCNIAGQYR